MSVKDVIAFAKENPICSIATLDGDQPRVRAFLAVFFDDDKIYFTTGATKNVFKQLSRNPKVEVCFLSQDFMKMMRITGEIEVIDDRPKKQKLIEEKDYLKGLTADDPSFILLSLSHGKATFWGLENNMREAEIKPTEF